MVGTLFKAFPQIQHLVTAGLEAAIFAVSGLGVDDLAAVFTFVLALIGRDTATQNLLRQMLAVITRHAICIHLRIIVDEIKLVKMN